MEIENEWFVAVHHIGIALGVSSDTIKGIVCNHLLQLYKFWRKKIGIDIPDEGSKLFTTITGACRVISKSNCWLSFFMTFLSLGRAEKVAYGTWRLYTCS